MQKILIVLFLFLSSSVYGLNVQINSVFERYLDALRLSGDARNRSLSFRSLSTNEWSIEGETHPWHLWFSGVEHEQLRIEPLAQRAFVSYNSYYPSGGNDFEVWQGVGFNAWLDGGVRVTQGDWFQATIAPRVSAAENRDYPTLDSAVESGYGYFVGGIDLPQRFGSDPYFQVSPGESEVRFSHRSLSLAFGTQSIWLGPARFNPLIMSNNAGGFPHLDITLTPTTTRIGDVGFTAVWGVLRESDYFDDDSDNDLRFTALLGASYAPRWIPGLTVGFNRFIQSPWSDLTAGSIVEPFTERMSSALGDDNKDQRASITAEWRFPTVGFETYFEWARNDYSPNRRAIVRAPEHSNAYTIGVRQLIPTARSDNRLVVFGELTQLIHSRDYYIDLGMGQEGFYHHGINRQGHTHRGQILGAQIGTGADSQTVGVDWFLPRGLLGAKIVRTSRNKDYVYGAPDAGPGDIERMNVEMLYEISGGLFVSSNIMIEASMSFANNINWNYEEGNDVQNVRLFTGVTYQP